MRVLLLFRGSPACGKSTFIEQHGLKPYTLCADDIRLLCASPTLQVDGGYGISQSNDKVVWNTLFNILETRMQNGEFTVIDATNSKTVEMNRYKELAQHYRYRIYCIDMTDIPIDEVKRRNYNREPMKRVPDEVIDKMYSRFATQQIPAGIKVLKPDEIDQIYYRFTDLSQYENVYVVGDIHGCYTALKQLMESCGGLKDEDCWIFCGDYVDRGVENVETMQFLHSLINKKNVIFLEGNHERCLWDYGNDVISKSKEFEFVTKPQLIKGGFSRKQAREFYRKLGQCCYFKYHNQLYFANHGGVSNMPANPLFIPSEQMIEGVGRYDDVDKVDIAWSDNFKAKNVSAIQIHGHRNTANSPIWSTPYSYNLEGSVEFGGMLRCVRLTLLSSYPVPIAVQNDVYKTEEEIQESNITKENIDTSIYSLVETMRSHKYIRENRFGNISAFNFTKQAFQKDIWDKTTVKARGLFINTKDYKVVARGYEKFWNINQMPETKIANLKFKLQFPVQAYVKENGFLGIVSWDVDNDDLFICSKSTPVGEYSNYMKNALYSCYDANTISQMKEYIKENNVSFVFECCDAQNDPHIIEYPETKVVLLDIINNDIEFGKLPYYELKALARHLGLQVKIHAYTLDSWEQFYAWYCEVTEEDYKFNDKYIEGFVIEDSVGYMTKLKLAYYNKWKHLRSVAQAIIKYGHYKYTGSLNDSISNEFHGWCKRKFTNLSREEREALSKLYYCNVIKIRNQFFEDMTNKTEIEGE